MSLGKGFSSVKYQICEESLEETLKTCKKNRPKIHDAQDAFRKKDYEMYLTPAELAYVRKKGGFCKTERPLLSEEERAHRRDQIKSRMSYVPLQQRNLKSKTQQQNFR